MNHILITGGAGFIGFHLARYHVQRGDRVFILDSLFKSGKQKDDLFQEMCAHPQVQFHELDLTMPVPDLKIPAIDIVYHLAAINGTQLFYDYPYEVARTNLVTLIHLLDWLQLNRCKRLVFASSSEVYADAESVGLLDIPTGELAPVVFTQPTNVRFSYGISKFTGEFLALHFGKTYDISVSVVRYHNVYGPRMGTKHVIPEFFERLRVGEHPFKLYGGDETRAFCYVDDAVRATHLVAESLECVNEIVHIGNSTEEIRILDLAKMMMSLTGNDVPIQECGRRSGSVSRRCPDISKLQKLTGFQPAVSLHEGLTRMMDEIRSGDVGKGGMRGN